MAVDKMREGKGLKEKEVEMKWANGSYMRT